MRAFTWPAGATDPPCLLWALPVGMAPYVAGALDRWLQSSQWTTREDYWAAYSAVGEVLSCMTSLCVSTLIESNDRLYRLLDNSLNGVTYSYELVDDVPVISPDIPVVPAAVTRSIHSRLERLEYLQDNAFNGAAHLPDFGDTDGIRAKLDRLIDAINALNTGDGDLLTQLELIASLLA